MSTATVEIDECTIENFEYGVNVVAGSVSMDGTDIETTDCALQALGSVSVTNAEFSESGIGVHVKGQNCIIGPAVSISSVNFNGVYVDSCEVTLDDVAIKNCGLHGILVFYGNVSLEGEIEITDCDNSGLRIEYSTVSVLPGGGGKVTITNGINAGLYTVAATVIGANLTLSGNTNGVYSTLGSDVTMRGCTISTGTVAFNADATSTLDAGRTSDYGGNVIDHYTLYAVNGNGNATLEAVGNCWDTSENPSSRKFVGLGPIVWLPGDCQ